MNSTAELMVAEAVGLVNTLDNWSVLDTIVLSTKTPEKRKIFGKGNFQLLSGAMLLSESLLEAFSEGLTRHSPPSALLFPPERIRNTAGATAVFVNVERLSYFSEVRQ